MILPWAFLALASYLVGAFPSSYLAGRLKKIDLRQHGSKSLGASNVFRVLGAGPAALVLTVDIFKGFAPVHWLPALAGQSAADPRTATVLAIVLGFAAVAGHIFSPFAGFRGGKGVATACGVFLALCPVALGLCLAVWLVLMAVFRIVSVASLGAALCLPFSVWFTLEHGNPGFNALQTFSILIAAVVIWAHRSNIARLLKGQENKLSRKGG